MEKHVLIEVVASKILLIRGKRVMLDKDLAALYEVQTKNLNKAVKRNTERFPEDFMFQLTKEEVETLRFQIGTSKRGGRKYLPYVFTQEGVAMLSGVLHSKRAVKVNIQIMRAFVRLRSILSSHKEFEVKWNELEKRIESHDMDISDIFEAIRQLIGIPNEKRKIKGFTQR